MAFVTAPRGAALERELARLLGSEAVLSGDAPGYSSDQTEGRGGAGQAQRGHRGPARAPRGAIEETIRIGRRHGLEGLSWGHAGDGNLHSTTLVDPRDDRELERAAAASAELLGMAIRLGGSVSGEHGLGWVRRGALERQWAPAALDLHERIKRAFDPKGRINPGKKTARSLPGNSSGQLFDMNETPDKPAGTEKHPPDANPERQAGEEQPEKRPADAPRETDPPPDAGPGEPGVTAPKR